MAGSKRKHSHRGSNDNNVDSIPIITIAGIDMIFEISVMAICLVLRIFGYGPVRAIHIHQNSAVKYRILTRDQQYKI